MSALVGNRWFALLFAMLFLSGTVACKQKSAPPAPAKKGSAQGAEDPLDDADDDSNDESDDPESDDETDDDDPEVVPLSIAPATPAALKIGTASPANVAFTLTGADGKDLILGLSEAPIGVKLARTGNTVTMSWAAPLKGSYGIRFVLRDRAACEAAESDASKCEIPEADYGRIGVKGYDIASERFTLEVTEGGGLLGGGGGGNGTLIDQITGLLGGGGNVQGLLQGLSNGQLQQVLGLAQGGFDLSSITALLGL